jgi:hypothetical protein
MCARPFVSTHRALLTVLRPVVAFIASRAACRALAASPSVRSGLRLTAAGTLLTVLRPVVAFIASRAACRALAADPCVTTEQTLKIHRLSPLDFLRV